MTEAKKKILFLCTGNAARSQMAEALARIDYGDLLAPVSAGSRPAGFVHPLAIRAIEELGFSMGRAHSKSADDFLDDAFDVVVTVCDSAAADCPIWTGAKHLVHWSIEDPSFLPGDEAKRFAAFRATRDELRRRIDGLLEVLRRPLAQVVQPPSPGGRRGAARRRDAAVRVQVRRPSRADRGAPQDRDRGVPRGETAPSSCRCAPESAW